MEVPNAFDCIPHYLLIVKLSAYGLSFETVPFLNRHLRNRKQFVKINSICSEILKMLSGVPKGCILGPMLFNILLNELFLCLENRITQLCKR